MTATATRVNALTGSQIELLTRAAHKALESSDVIVSPSKVARIVRRFGHALKRSHMTFHEFLGDEANRDRLRLADPELFYTLAYYDKVGEDAVNNVMRERGW